MRFILVLIITLLSASCASFGERFIINTDKHTEDFLIVCKKTLSNFPSFHGASTSTYIDKVFIVNSGEEETCGFIVFGYNSNAYASHPTYTYTLWEQKESSIKYSENGVEIKEFLHWKERNKQAIKLYEEGFWGDTYKYKSYDPLKEFLKNISTCSISRDYLEKYNQSATLKYHELKNKYYDEILACNRENEKIRHKYGKSTNYFYYTNVGRHNQRLKRCTETGAQCNKNNKIYMPEKTILSINAHNWGAYRWANFLSDEDKEEIHLNKKIKNIFIVGYNLTCYKPKRINTFHAPECQYSKAYSDQAGNRPTWFIVHASDRKIIENKLSNSDFIVFDNEPTWIPDYKVENFIKNCEGTNLNVDIDNLTAELQQSLYYTAAKKFENNVAIKCLNNI